jgi:hypothetical protein
MRVKLKDRTITTTLHNDDDIEWIKTKAKELSPLFENFSASMNAFLRPYINENYFEHKTYLKTYGNVNEFMDLKLRSLLVNIQTKHGIRKPFKLVMWDMLMRAANVTKEDRDFHTLSAIACRLVDTFYYFQRAKEEETKGTNMRIAKLELECRGYFGEKIRLDSYKIWGDKDS